LFTSVQIKWELDQRYKIAIILATSAVRCLETLLRTQHVTVARNAATAGFKLRKYEQSIKKYQ